MGNFDLPFFNVLVFILLHFQTLFFNVLFMVPNVFETIGEFGKGFF